MCKLASRSLPPRDGRELKRERGALPILRAAAGLSDTAAVRSWKKRVKSGQIPAKPFVTRRLQKMQRLALASPSFDFASLSLSYLPAEVKFGPTFGLIGLVGFDSVWENAFLLRKMGKNSVYSVFIGLYYGGGNRICETAYGRTGTCLESAENPRKTAYSCLSPLKIIRKPGAVRRRSLQKMLLGGGGGRVRVVGYDYYSESSVGSGRGLRDARAVMSRFGYWRDPLFLLASGAYALNRWVLKPLIPSPFLHNHFNDLLLIPAALPVMLWIQRILGLRKHDAVPTWPEILMHWAIWSIVCEWIGPFYCHMGVADIWDVVSYAVGGVVAGVWWNRVAIFSPDEPGLGEENGHLSPALSPRGGEGEGLARRAVRGFEAEISASKNSLPEQP